MREEREPVDVAEELPDHCSTPCRCHPSARRVSGPLRWLRWSRQARPTTSKPPHVGRELTVSGGRGARVPPATPGRCRRRRRGRPAPHRLLHDGSPLRGPALDLVGQRAEELRRQAALAAHIDGDRAPDGSTYAGRRRAPCSNACPAPLLLTAQPRTRPPRPTERRHTPGSLAAERPPVGVEPGAPGEQVGGRMRRKTAPKTSAAFRPAGSRNAHDEDRRHAHGPCRGRRATSWPSG